MDYGVLCTVYSQAWSFFQLKGAERTAARWVSPQKPGTSVRVDSAVGQMSMFRPRNKWAAVQDCRRREEQKSRAWIGVGGAVCDVSGARLDREDCRRGYGLWR
jgi:hypothetical protein